MPESRIMDTNVPHIPLADKEKVTTDYVHLFISNTMDYIFKNAEHDNTLQHGIIIGLLVKQRKLYNSTYRLASENDLLSFHIIARSFYEVTISLRYILQYLESNKTIKEFLIGDAMGQIYRLNGELKNKEIDKEKFNFELDQLKRHLNSESIGMNEIPRGLPRSWHPNKSYRDLARLLDDTGEALQIYDIFYASTSQLAHPSLADIMRWHVTQMDEGSPFIPNEHKMFAHADIEVIPQCMSLASLEVLTASATEFNHLTDEITGIHLRLHESYNGSAMPLEGYLASLHEYAMYWSQNYPELGM